MKNGGSFHSYVSLQRVNGKKITGWWCNNHLEKYGFVNGKDDIPYMKWKIKFMFETINKHKNCDSWDDYSA